MSTIQPDQRPTAPLSRASSGRWLGGVCTGLAEVRMLNVVWIRLAFVLLALLGGLGILIYVSCWLIIPEEDDEAGTAGASGIVVLAQATAACTGLVTLAALGVVATIFGFGWAVLVIAALVLIGVLAAWPRLGPGWALLPIAAMAVPSVAVAARGWQLAPETGHVRVAPRTLIAGPRPEYRSGLGTMLVDLRDTSFPASGTVSLRIDGGVRRTIVALPSSACVHVDVTHHLDPFLGDLGSLLTGRPQPFPGVVVFGRPSISRSGEVGSGGVLSGPLLKIDFHSVGGSLYVRDYPDDVNPDVKPYWPGYPVTPEPRPYIKGLSRRAARALIAHWQARYRVQVSDAHRIRALTPGPCSVDGASQ